MDDNKKCEISSCSCSCNSCSGGKCCHSHCGCWWHHPGGNIWLRWLLGVLVLLLVFWMGLKIGEFKGEFGDDGFYSANWGMMRGMRQPQYNMMPNYYYRTGGGYGQPYQYAPQQ